MADMRLIVAGAGGRMGRTLVKAIAETKGLALAGAVDGAGLAGDRPGRGRAGGPAGQRHQAHGRRRRRCSPMPTASIDFTMPEASVALAALTAGQGAHHRHHRAFAPMKRRGSRNPPRAP